MFLRRYQRFAPAFIFGIMILALCSGCATLVSERRYPVTIDNPPGPTYFSVIDQENNVIQQGVTPQQVTLDAKRYPFIPAKYSVVFAGGSNTSQTKEIRAKPDPWIVGNLVVGGVPGIIVDGASGAMYKLPKKVEGFVPTQATITDAGQGATIANAVAFGTPANSVAQPAESTVVSAQLSDENDGIGTQQVPVRTASAIGSERITQ
ncbi:hypothetical protein ACMFWY_00475 [Roseiconus sp. JC912]